MAKLHGSINNAGKVKKRTEAQKVSKAEKPRAPPRGRAMKRRQYNRRIANVTLRPGMRAPGPNQQSK